MKNAVGREIPDFLLENGKEVYQGKNYMDGKYVQKASPRTRRYEKPQESKIVETIKDALIQCGAKDGMTFSFHHHLRNGDYTLNRVMNEIAAMGIRELTPQTLRSTAGFLLKENEDIETMEHMNLLGNWSYGGAAHG